MNYLVCEGKTGFSQTYLLSRVVNDAQGAAKIPFFIREIGFNTLRWESVSVILQIPRDSSLSLRVTFFRVILSETKDV